MYSEQPSSHEMPNLYVVLLGTVMKPARRRQQLIRMLVPDAMLRSVGTAPAILHELGLQPLCSSGLEQLALAEQRPVSLQTTQPAATLHVTAEDEP